ncbi:transcription termination factor Rho [Fibrobacter sp. UWP2]|uniref:transcription termination factor Rho n=1 Tax=Fibrobacter sp. UWP2 TaxID=1896216 RepID=UPI00090F2966|nr:transcription termination factor Rho [Fibrobacter sp. UWP2]
MPRTKKNLDQNEVVEPVEAAEEAKAAPKKRGRTPKKASEKADEKVAENATEKKTEAAPVEKAPEPPTREKPTTEFTPAPEAPAANTAAMPAEGSAQATNNSAEGAPAEGTPQQGQNNGQQGDQNNRHFNNNNNQNNNRNNGNNQNNGNNRFNKFNKFKNRHNRNLPQDDFLDESIQLPPPDPEQVAAARAKWKQLRGLPMFELQSKAEELGIVDYKKMRKQALVYSILSATNGEDTPIYTEGVLEIIPEGGHGFLRNPEHNYLAGPDDIYISKNIIRRYDLKMGDTITGQVRQPREGEKYFALLRIDTVNFEPPEKTKRRVAFEYLTPIHPIERLNLEFDSQEYSTRLMNLFTPIGKGQRSIVLAPPRTGKTVLLQNVTKAITANHPEVKLIVLLIDERPEEVTEMRKLIDRLKEESAARGKNIMAEVLASTFDEEPGRHIKVASLVLEKAKRLVEHGNDVVILLDSITRFARANNVAIPHSGKILSGGVDANAMQLPKKFFGAARKIENGGSLTIVGTALIETGSRMDEVIFEEFKGTGNMELVLDRRIAEKRIWPAIDIFKSGTRKEELLLTEEEMRRVWILRRYLQDMTTVEIMEFLRDKLKLFKTNFDFLGSMNG